MQRQSSDDLFPEIQATFSQPADDPETGDAPSTIDQLPFLQLLGLPINAEPVEELSSEEMDHLILLGQSVGSTSSTVPPPSSNTVPNTAISANQIASTSTSSNQIPSPPIVAARQIASPSKNSRRIASPPVAARQIPSTSTNTTNVSLQNSHTLQRSASVPARRRKTPDTALEDLQKQRSDISHTMRTVYKIFRENTPRIRDSIPTWDKLPLGTHEGYAILLSHLKMMSPDISVHIPHMKLIECLKKENFKLAQLNKKYPKLPEVINLLQNESDSGELSEDSQSSESPMSAGTSEGSQSQDPQFYFNLIQMWPNKDMKERWELIKTIKRPIHSTQFFTTKELFNSSWTIVSEGFLRNQHVAIKQVSFLPGKQYTEMQIQDEIFLLCVSNLFLPTHIMPILGWSVDFTKSEATVITPYSSLSLKAHVKSLLTDADCLNACIDVAKALQALHQLGIAHRSIRLDSVYVVDGVCKLANFGRACLIHTPRETGPNNDFSSPLLAPELRQFPLTNCQKADIFSFGVLVWAVWTKLNPTKYRELTLKNFGLAWDPQIPLPVPTESCPIEIVELLKRCWAPIPDDRPSAEEILTILLDLTEDVTTPNSVNTPHESEPVVLEDGSED